MAIKDIVSAGIGFDPGSVRFIVTRGFLAAVLPTIRQQLMAAVKTRFEAILVSGGYNYDLGGSVHEWRATPLEDADLPALTFRDATELAESEESADYQVNHLGVKAEVVTMEGAATPSGIKKMIADIYKAVGVDVTWGGLAVRTDLPEDKTQTEQKDSIVGGSIIRFNIVYGTPSWDPYTAL